MSDPTTSTVPCILEAGLMAMTAINPLVHALPKTAADHLQGLAIDPSEAAERQLRIMIKRGSAECRYQTVKIRFENLSSELRTSIRLRQRDWGWQDAWANVPGTAADVLPALPLNLFGRDMRTRLCALILEGKVVPIPSERGPLIQGIDCLAAHSASVDTPYRPLATFDYNPTVQDMLLADGVVVMRSGKPSVPWTAIDEYSSFGADPSDWEVPGEYRLIVGPC
jgi:hypothetical protein